MVRPSASTFHIGLGASVVTHPHEHDPVERMVRVPVATAVQPVPVTLPEPVNGSGAVHGHDLCMCRQRAEILEVAAALARIIFRRHRARQASPRRRRTRPKGGAARSRAERTLDPPSRGRTEHHLRVGPRTASDPSQPSHWLRTPEPHNHHRDSTPIERLVDSCGQSRTPLQSRARQSVIRPSNRANYPALQHFTGMG